MKTFDEVVSLALAGDVWALDCLARQPDSMGLDGYRKSLSLTPAGELAKQGRWEAVGLLFDTFKVDIKGILFGAVLGGCHQQVMKYINSDYSSPKDVLVRVCKHVANPLVILPTIIQALACQDKHDEVDKLLKKYDPLVQKEKGLLQAALEGAAFTGNLDRVQHLLDKIRSDASLCQAEESWLQPLLNAAAEGGQERCIQQWLPKDAQSAETSCDFETEMSVYIQDKLKPMLEPLLRNSHAELLRPFFYLILAADRRIDIENNVNRDNASPFNEALDTEALVFDEVKDFIKLAKKYGQIELIRAMVTECLERYFSEDDRKIIAQELDAVHTQSVPPMSENMQYLMTNYQLTYGHAKQLENHVDLVDAICEHKISDADKKKVAECLIPGLLEPMMVLIQKHQPRKLFINALKQYCRSYYASWFFGQNHIARAESVLGVICFNTRDDDFAALIQQQWTLLSNKKHLPVLGDPKAKHNQPVNHCLKKDGFTIAVRDCYKAIQSNDLFCSGSQAVEIEEDPGASMSLPV